MLGKSVRLAVRDIALGAEDLEVEIEDLIELTVPVVDKAGRDNHQRAVKLAAARKLAQDQRRLDGLAKAHFIGNQKSPGRCSRHAMRQHDLVRQQVDLGGGQRGGALHDWQRMGFVARPARLFGIKRRERLARAGIGRPTATGYFSRIGKPAILAIIEEATGKKAAPAWQKLTRGELAKRAEKAVKPTKWLPALLRIAPAVASDEAPLPEAAE